MQIQEPRIFISYSMPDSSLAQELCRYLEGRGLPCWIAPRDMEAGHPFSQSIVECFENSYAMVLVLSRASNVSDYVFGEIGIAFKRRIPILEYRIDSVVLHKRLEIYLTAQHYIDATAGNPRKHLAKLYTACFAKKTGTRAPIQKPVVRIAPVRWLIPAALALAILATAIYLSEVRKETSKAKMVTYKIPDTLPIKPDSTGPASILPPKVSDTHVRVIHHPAQPSASLLALDGAIFIDGPASALTRSTDKIKFYGVEGGTINFYLNIGIYSISGKMKIDGKRFSMIQADPPCVGEMSLLNDGTELRGSFHPKSSADAKEFDLVRLRQ